MYFSKFSYRINLILENKYLPKLSRKLLISSLIMKFFARNFFPNLILEVSVFIRRKINSLLERFAKEIIIIIVAQFDEDKRKREGNSIRSIRLKASCILGCYFTLFRILFTTKRSLEYPIAQKFGGGVSWAVKGRISAISFGFIYTRPKCAVR